MEPVEPGLPSPGAKSPQSMHRQAHLNMVDPGGLASLEVCQGIAMALELLLRSEPIERAGVDTANLVHFLEERKSSICN